MREQRRLTKKMRVEKSESRNQLEIGMTEVTEIWKCRESNIMDIKLGTSMN